jgi:hypothetical protein
MCQSTIKTIISLGYNVRYKKQNMRNRSRSRSQRCSERKLSASTVILVNMSTLPTYEKRVVIHTLDPDVVIVFARDIKPIVGKNNDAFKVIKKKGLNPKTLGISAKFTAKDVAHFKMQKRCLKGLSKETTVNVEFVDVISKNIIAFLNVNSPEWISDIIGIARKYVPTWLQTAFDKSLDIIHMLGTSPVIMMLSTIVYTVLKVFLCVWSLPTSSISVAAEWLKLQMNSTSASVGVFCHIAKSILECSEGMFMCTKSTMSLIWSILGVSASWIGTVFSYLLPLQSISNFDKLIDYTPNWFEKVFEDPISMRIKFMNAPAIDKDMLNNIIARIFPNAGLKVLKMLLQFVKLFVHDPVSLKAIKRFEVIIIDKVIHHAEQLFEIFARFKGYRAVYAVLMFVWNELHALTTCFLLNKNCCFSPSVISLWSKGIIMQDLKNEL